MHHALIDHLACGNTLIHRLDARVKLLVTLALSVFVLGIDPRRSGALWACAIWPFTILVLGQVPLRFAVRQIALVSPFVLVLAAANVWYGRQEVPVRFGPFEWQTTTGVLRSAVVIGKFIVTMAALIGLAATTRFGDLIAALGRLGVPRVLVTQLGFLYRYIFLLIHRADHVLEARSARKLRYIGAVREVRTAGAMIGALFVSSLDTADHVSHAMQARGFDGRMQSLRPMRLKTADGVYATAFIAYLAALWTLLGGL